MALPDLAPLAGLTPDALADLRQAIAAAGYTAARLDEAQSVAPSPLRLASGPVVRAWLTRRGDAGATLARLFAFDDAVPAEALRAALPDELVEALSDAGVLAREGDRIRARYLLTPMEDGPLVLSDPLWAGDAAVMGTSAGTAFVARTIPRPFDGSLLDVGCGAGSLALVAAMRGARRVLGVDINPRAVELARFNAALNGVAAEFRAGDLTAPAAGERFDRVVAQPPFVARPAGVGEITFLHGGTYGDELALRLLGECPGALAPGGVATALFQSPVRANASVFSRIREALGAADGTLDLVALRMQGGSPALQAMVFASHESDGFDARYEAAVRRYLDHFAALDAREVEGVFAVLTRPDAASESSRRYGASLPSAHAALTAAELDALRARLALSAADDVALLRAGVVLGAGLRVVTERASVARDAPQRWSLRLDPRAVAVEGEVSADELERLRAFEGAATVERALIAYARARRRSPPQLRDEFLPWVRGALVAGTLAAG
ncbi:MAG: methyltransferase [Polyangiales bacterium]